MNKEYKVLPFSELAIGQEFEFSIGHKYLTLTPWVKMAESKFGGDDSTEIEWNDWEGDYGCLVRTADCEPVLDFDTWWDKCDNWKSTLSYASAKNLARRAWDKAKAN